MFYILNNGGDIRYPPNGLTTAERDDYSRRIPELYDSGFYFHYDSVRNHVISFFKGRVNIGDGDQLISNQFYGVYYGEDSSRELLPAFREEVESAFASQGWQTSESDQGPDQIYSNLLSAPAVDLAIDDTLLQELLRELRDDDDPIQLGAPDFTSALQVCKSLITLSDGLKVTVCTSGNADALPVSDVVVIPNDTEEPGAPTRETRERIEEERLKRRIGAMKSKLQSFVKGDNTNDGVSERAIAETLESGIGNANVPKPTDLGIRITTQRRKSEQQSRTATLSALVGGAVGLIPAFYLLNRFGFLDGIFAGLSSTFPQNSDFIPNLMNTFPMGAFQGSSIVGVCTLLILLIGVLPSHNRVTSALPGKRASSTAGPHESTAGNSPSTDAVEASTFILEKLGEFQNDPAIDRVGGFDQVCADVFENTVSLDIYDPFSYNKDRIQTAVFSLLGGAVIATIVFLLLGIVVSTWWDPSLAVLILVSLLIVGLRLLQVFVAALDLLVESYRAGVLPDSRTSLIAIMPLVGALAANFIGDLIWRNGGPLSQPIKAITSGIPGGFISGSAGMKILLFGVFGLLFVLFLIISRR